LKRGFKSPVTPRLEEITKDLFFFGKDGMGMDDIEDDEQDRFWDNSEEDSFEESEGDVEIHIAECNDIQDDSARYWDKS
jgi:hypothetical protein